MEEDVNVVRSAKENVKKAKSIKKKMAIFVNVKMISQRNARKNVKKARNLARKRVKSVNVIKIKTN